MDRDNTETTLIQFKDIVKECKKLDIQWEMGTSIEMSYTQDDVLIIKSVRVPMPTINVFSSEADK